MDENFPKGQKTLWEKEKLLVTSNFSFSHCVFKSLVLPTRKNKGLFYWHGHTLQGTLFYASIDVSLKILILNISQSLFGMKYIYIFIANTVIDNI